MKQTYTKQEIAIGDWMTISIVIDENEHAFVKYHGTNGNEYNANWMTVEYEANSESEALAKIKKYIARKGWTSDAVYGEVEERESEKYQKASITIHVTAEQDGNEVHVIVSRWETDFTSNIPAKVKALRGTGLCKFGGMRELRAKIEELYTSTAIVGWDDTRYWIEKESEA